MGTIHEITSEGTEISAVNSTSTVEIGQASDIPATLAANTTYIVRGIVTTSAQISVTNDNCAILGYDRNKDGLIFTGTGDFMTVTDVNFQLSNIKISNTNSTGGEVCLRAANVNYGTYNDGRNKVLTMTNCQFRNCYDVWHIEGFDLVDIQNTLVWYSQASAMGCHFKNNSKLQISSCEYVRWFDEDNLSFNAWDVATAYIPGDKVLYNGIFWNCVTGNTGEAPPNAKWEAHNYATVPMVELLANGVGSGFGAVNISGGIFHPQQTQDGISINNGSTTGFGTISSTAFVNVGLDTGSIFLPEATGLPDYSEPETLKYDIFANQGILNSTSGVNMTFTGNTTPTTLAGSGTPAVMNSGGLAVTQAAVRYETTAAGRCTYIGSKQVYVSIHASLSYEKQGGGVDPYSFFFYKNGVALTDSVSEINADDEASSALSMVYGTLMEQDDYIEIYIQRDSGGSDDMLVKDLQLVVRE